jgi:PAS domain S-box-containing protein
MGDRERINKLPPADDCNLEQQELEDVLALKERALAASAEGITIADARLADEPLVYVNAGFERLTGYTREEILGRNCRFLQGSEAPPDVRAEIRRAITEQRECTVEIRNYRKDGTPFWNRLSITPVRDGTGAVTHFIGIQSDITARKLAEEELRCAKEELEVANRRMKSDLDAAARVQRTLLPHDLPKVQGVEFAWVFEPCDELAGDTFGISSLDDTHLMIYHLDVSGHGVSASLLSVTLSHWLAPSAPPGGGGASRTSGDAMHGTSAPASVVGRLNQQFPMDTGIGQYFTMFYGIFDTQARSVHYVTAGHPPPVHLRPDGESRLLTTGGIPVGLFPESTYEEATIELSPGDRLYLYSDGITEARNSDDEEFGLTRLLQVARRGRAGSLQASLDALVTSVSEWSGGTRPDDDLSILALAIDSE